MNNIERKDNSPSHSSSSLFHKIRFVKEDILDIINGQGCLIRENTTILFSRHGKIKDFEQAHKVTSNGYVTCAEVVGKFSTGSKFYIHALDSHDFAFTLKQIIAEEKTQSKEQHIEIEHIDITADFDGMHDAPEGSMGEYRRVCRKIGIQEDDIEIQNTLGVDHPKVVSYTKQKARDF